MKTVASLTLVIAVLLVLIGCEPIRSTPDPYTCHFDRIEIPAEFPPHPRLFMDQAEIDELKVWIERDAKLREYVDGFLAEMRETAKDPKLPGEGVHNHHVAVQANKLALWVWLELKDVTATFSDNFFQLLPGKPVEIEIYPWGELPLYQIEKQLLVRSLVDTYREG